MNNKQLNQVDMKIEIIKSLCFLMLAGFLAGCNDIKPYDIEKGIYVNKTSVNLFVGESAQLTASPVGSSFDWNSEDPTVATVSKSGLVEAVSAGSTNIVALLGNASTKIAVTAVERIPLQDVLLDTDYAELTVGRTLKVQMTLVPSNANDAGEFSWTSESPSIATVDKSGEITAKADGVTKIILQGNGITRFVTVDVATTRAFKGPHILSAVAPCEIPAADFDIGGEGLAFHDSDATGSNSYRRDNGDPYSVAVDVEGNGTNIGGAPAGEWLLYTVEVEDAGDYLAEISLSANGNANFHLELDGVNVTGSVPVSSNGSWSNWRWLPVPDPISIPAGKHKIKYYFETGNHNLRALRFTKQ
jgi:hypothetical protein